MIVSIPYEQVKGNNLNGVYEDKEYSFYMRIGVNEDNVIEAISQWGTSRNVIAFDYDGDLSKLASLPSISKAIIIHKKIDLSVINIEMYLVTVPKTVRVVLELEDNYSDMRTLKHLSSKYPQVRFCGGNVIRLNGVNLGCILQDDLPKKVAASKIGVVCKGCSCIDKTIKFEDVTNPIFTMEVEKIKNIKTGSKDSDNEKVVTSKVKPKTTNNKTKKIINSLTERFGDFGLGF